MSELRPKFECELNAGCLVISNTFAVPGWDTDRVCTVKDQHATQIFVYEMPAKVELYQVVEPAVMNDLKFVRKPQ